MAAPFTLTESSTPALLDAHQAAAFLKLSATTLKRMRRSGRFGPEPVVFSKRLVRYSRAELESWVAAGCPTRKDWAARKGGAH